MGMRVGLSSAPGVGATKSSVLPSLHKVCSSSSLFHKNSESVRKRRNVNPSCTAGVIDTSSLPSPPSGVNRTPHRPNADSGASAKVLVET
jgi:hypothetical protein